MNKIGVLIILVLLISCKKDNSVILNSHSINSPNILLIISDDLGKDALNGFSEGIIKPKTPNIDGLRNEGLYFTNFWTYPTCSPTRASIITGKYGYHTGVKWANDEINTSETILQRYINDNNAQKYATAIVGKWHLSGNKSSINPESFGIDYYAGIFNGAVQSYFDWKLNSNGVNTNVSKYVTKKLTDISIEWIKKQDNPWFIRLAYNAPHTPFHVPPTKMHNQGNLPIYEDGMNPTPYYMAAIEAMDFQIGRLLDSLPSEEKNNTVILFLGDNGSPNQVVQSPYTTKSAKGSLYQGGINTPLFVSGKGISRNGKDENLITSSDLFSTITEISGIDNPEINDSKSFKKLFCENIKLRNYQYSEMKNGTSDSWTISNGNYKLIIDSYGNKEMYDLNSDSYEKNNLLNATISPQVINAKYELEGELNKIRN